MDTTDVPRYDPKRHTSDDEFVLVELYATTGDLFRRADPLGVIRPDAEEWVRLVLDAGGEPASPAYAIAARSGTPPEKGTEGAADPEDRKVPKGHDGTTGTFPFKPADPEDLPERPVVDPAPADPEED